MARDQENAPPNGPSPRFFFGGSGGEGGGGGGSEAGPSLPGLPKAEPSTFLPVVRGGSAGALLDWPALAGWPHMSARFNFGWAGCAAGVGGT
jgi:hypothetical protein